MNINRKGGRGKKSLYPTTAHRIPLVLMPIINKMIESLFNTGEIPKMLPSEEILKIRLKSFVDKHDIKTLESLNKILDAIYRENSF